jgi:hypothetical protein
MDTYRPVDTGRQGRQKQRLSPVSPVFGHLARDGREHAIQLLDELNAGQLDAGRTTERQS